MSDQRGSFADAVAAMGGRATADRSPAPPPTPPAPVTAASAVTAIIDTGVGLIDMRSGELIDLTAIDHEFLAGLAIELRKRETQIKQWRETAEAELVARHGDRKAPQVVGDLEVNVERKWSRQWDDPDVLETTLADLVQRGVIDARLAAGVVRIDARVDGTAAQKLLTRLDGEALEAVQGCFTWKEGRPKVTVTPIPDLADALPPAS